MYEEIEMAMTMTMTMMRSSARCIRGGGVGRRLRPPPARPERRDGDLPKPSRRNLSASGAGDEGRRGTAASRHPRPPSSTAARPRRRWLSASSAATRADAPRSGHHRTESERRRRSILAAALERVRDEGWTADAVAGGTLDAGFPPSYVGRASESTSALGSAELVAFFMEECNARLREELAEERRSEGGEDATGSRVGHATAEGVSSRIAKALRTRLCMVLPYVASERWHEGMAIGALPQNAYGTSQQLDDMATIVLDYALGTDGGNAYPANPAQRAAVVAAYAAAELHLLSDGKDAAASGGSSSSSGEERYHATWAFLEARAAEAARFVVDGGSSMPSFSGVPLPNPTHVVAASAVASSLAGAALSLAAPSVAAMAGHAVPRAMSMLAPLQDALSSRMSADQNYGTRPSHYAAEAEDLPPFDASEEIFPEGKASNA